MILHSGSCWYAGSSGDVLPGDAASWRQSAPDAVNPQRRLAHHAHGADNEIWSFGDENTPILEKVYPFQGKRCGRTPGN